MSKSRKSQRKPAPQRQPVSEQATTIRRAKMPAQFDSYFEPHFEAEGRVTGFYAAYVVERAPEAKASESSPGFSPAELAFFAAGDELAQQAADSFDDLNDPSQKRAPEAKASSSRSRGTVHRIISA
jgi:hypothetical protein